MSTRVRIDPTRCRGHGICALFAPDQVDLDRWGYGRVIEAVLDDRRSLRRARRAAAACPNGALVLVEDGAPGPDLSARIAPYGTGP